MIAGVKVTHLAMVFFNFDFLNGFILPKSGVFARFGWIQKELN